MSTLFICKINIFGEIFIGHFLMILFQYFSEKQVIPPNFVDKSGGFSCFFERNILQFIPPDYNFQNVL